jgi:hypothetical protein
MACCCGSAVPKCNCPNDPPSSIDVTVFGATGNFAFLNGTYTLNLFSTQGVIGSPYAEWFWRITLSGGAYVEYRIFCVGLSTTSRLFVYGAVLSNGGVGPRDGVGNTGDAVNTSTSGVCVFSTPRALSGFNLGGSFSLTSP